MLNKVFQTTLTLCSITVYIVSLVIVFDYPWLAEYIENSLFRNYSYECRSIYLISLTIFLTFPDIIAIISYAKNRMNNFDMNHQLSGFCRCFIDAVIIVTILSFLNEKLLLSEPHSYQNALSQAQFSMNILFSLSFIFFWFSQPFRFLTNIISIENAYAYLKELVNEPPYINFHVNAYHYEARIRLVTETYTDSQGKSQTTFRNEYYQERVTSLSLSEPYKIKFWRDATNLQELLSSQKIRVVKIKIKTLINPVDSITKQHYDTEWSNFCRKYKGADSLVDFSMSSGLTKMKTNLLLAFLNLKERPLFLNIFFYFVISFTPFSWAYSLWLDQISAVSEITILKEYSQFDNLGSCSTT